MLNREICFFSTRFECFKKEKNDFVEKMQSNLKYLHLW